MSVKRQVAKRCPVKTSCCAEFGTNFRSLSLSLLVSQYWRRRPKNSAPGSWKYKGRATGIHIRWFMNRNRAKPK
jgi:hypothetical protein